jgi:putative ABC transport system substrate-binding protein
MHGRDILQEVQTRRADVRRRDLLAFAAGAAIWPAAARGQGAERMRRVGLMSNVLPGDRWQRLPAYKKALADLGWIEGRNIAFEFRTIDDPAKRQAIAQELVSLNVDLVIANSTPDTAALLAATRTIPVVFSTAADPVGNGFVKSLAHPGGNATGFTNSDATMSPKWLEFLKEIAPRITRVGVLFNPLTAPRRGEYYLEPLRQAALSFGITLDMRAVGKPTEIDAAAASLAGDLAGGLIVLPDSFLVLHRRVVIDAAARHKVPAIYPFRYFSDEGGLISYGAIVGAQSSEAHRAIIETIRYVDLILRGTPPGDLPVQSPRVYELLVNAKAAAALGLEIPEVLVARADQIIE